MLKVYIFIDFEILKFCKLEYYIVIGNCLLHVVMLEDVVMDGYEEIMKIDISVVAIDMMRKKHDCVPQSNVSSLQTTSVSVLTSIIACP